jgi:hypothetical protein
MRLRKTLGPATLAVATLLALCLGGCGGGSTVLQTCTTQAECPLGQLCIDGFCRGPDGGGDVPDGESGGDGDGDGDADGDADADGADGDADSGCAPGETPCSGTCCATDQRCRVDACFDDLGTCTTDDDCWSDSWCEAGVCIPYGVPPGHDNDDECSRPIDKIGRAHV